MSPFLPDTLPFPPPPLHTHTHTHTFSEPDCAALTFTETSLREKLLSKTLAKLLPATAPFSITSTKFLPFPPPPPNVLSPLHKSEARLKASVQWDVDWLRGNPLFDQRTRVSGWIYEVETGRLREVDTGAEVGRPTVGNTEK